MNVAEACDWTAKAAEMMLAIKGTSNRQALKLVRESAAYEDIKKNAPREIKDQVAAVFVEKVKPYVGGGK